jgi:hypothetical protein
MDRMMEPGGRSAGWYPDPRDSARRRYWDGAHWAALTQPPSIAPRGTSGPPVLGSPENPIGAGSVGLAAALAAITAARFDAAVAAGELDVPPRRRHLFRARH